MDEMAAALQFPHYFGENWDALDECLSDMHCPAQAAGMVLVIRDAIEVLASETSDRLAIFVRLLNDAMQTAASTVAQGEWWDRPSFPFHVVLQVHPEQKGLVTQIWEIAGAHVRDF